MTGMTGGIKPGWLNRWARESFHLMLRTPAAVLSACVILVAMGAVSEFMMGAMGVAMGLAAIPSLAFPLVGCGMGAMALLAIPMRQMAWNEGYLDTVLPSQAQVGEMLRGHARGAFLLAAIFALLGAMVLLFPAAPSAEGAPPPPAEIMTPLGSIFLTASHVQWVVFCMASGMSMVGYCDIAVNGSTAGQARDNATRRMGLATVSAPMCQFFLLAFFLFLPTFIGKFLGGWAAFAFCVYSLFFYYVASREILGGITGNRKRAAEEEARTAIAGA